MRGEPVDTSFAPAHHAPAAHAAGALPYGAPRPDWPRTSPRPRILGRLLVWAGGAVALLGVIMLIAWVN
jgi:hypothetical protein